MKILVLGDIHCRNFWRKAIEENESKVDKVIFLGDYLDPYPEEIKMTPELMECESFDDVESNLNMLNDIISLKKNDYNKYILLTGNHTDSYIWKNFNSATRTDYKNYKIYHKFFSENLSLFNLVYIQNNTIFSHAGISNGWAQKVWKNFEYQNDKFTSIMEIASILKDTPLNNFNNSLINDISDISYYRYGDMFYGSCEWADIKEHIDMKKSIDDIIPIGEEGIYQIFGHTQLRHPLINDKWACLDCRKAFIYDTDTRELICCK